MLVVSSDPNTRQLLLDLCAREGYIGVAFEDREQLLRETISTVDMIMPIVDLKGPSCFEWCTDMRTLDEFQHVPILLVTDTPPEPRWIAAALLSGADDVCSLADAHRDELRARVRVQLRNKRYRDAIGRLRAERNALRSRARTDALTGALKREELEAALHTEFEAGTPFGVLFIDVDHFKKVNDVYGHQMGDEVLRAVAKALSHGARGGDLCGRFGGEEFVLLLRSVTPEQAVSVAERHRAAVSRLTFSKRGPQQVTVSLGVATYDAQWPDMNLAQLLRRADRALYRAKAEGRNRVVLAAPAQEGPISFISHRPTISLAP